MTGLFIPNLWPDWRFLRSESDLTVTGWHRHRSASIAISFIWTFSVLHSYYVVYYVVTWHSIKQRKSAALILIIFCYLDQVDRVVDDWSKSHKISSASVWFQWVECLFWMNCHTLNIYVHMYLVWANFHCFWLLKESFAFKSFSNQNFIFGMFVAQREFPFNRWFGSRKSAFGP